MFVSEVASISMKMLDPDKWAAFAYKTSNNTVHYNAYEIIHVEKSSGL